LVEKLLRVTELKRIYLLLRPKGGKSAEDRLEKLCQSALFDRLRKTCDRPIERVTAILGDCNLANLGISAEDRQVLIDEVNVVIHLAATVRFDEPLCRALTINVRATLELIRLAKEMKQLEAFVHVSSAFANCVVNFIDEKYYAHKIGIGSVKMCELADTLGVETTNKLASVLCEKYKNTYTFTKSLAEEAVLNEGRSLPISVFRPAIVIQTYTEPLTGWIGNLGGPSAALYASGRGVLRVMHMKSQNRAHVVPADYCASLMIAIGWETAKSSTNKCIEMAPPIYNYCNDDENPLLWKGYLDAVTEHGYKVPLSKMIWYPFTTTVSQRWLYSLLAVFYHTIPGYILDFLLVLKGKKKRMTKIYRTIHRQSAALEYFTNNSFTFTMDNTKALWSSLTPKDREIFNFDLCSIKWDEYIQFTLQGLRLHLGKEGPETIPEAQKKFKRLKIIHRLTQVLLLAILITTLWTIFSRIFL
ncbi:PREDICTED: putative fatty acyl-CoA reductase CG5065, partial [Rhagoletis zephyria]|uniref:putative fatty acyl-CoA reductase CG5065 n=1 Tax=Rhagoletis zephyria TaxID=28612 RepID=UPI000811572D